MQALINGKPATLADGITVAALVQELGLAGQRIAVELNGDILPRSRHAETHITDGDRLEIVHAIGGGQI